MKGVDRRFLTFDFAGVDCTNFILVYSIWRELATKKTQETSNELWGTTSLLRPPEHRRAAWCIVLAPLSLERHGRPAAVRKLTLSPPTWYFTF